MKLVSAAFVCVGVYVGVCVGVGVILWLVDIFIKWLIYAGAI